jgi:hypothetical protein
MEPRRAGAQNFDEAAAEPRAAAWRCDHQRPAQAEMRRFVGGTHQRARREHDALALDIVNERCDHPTRRP